MSDESNLVILTSVPNETEAVAIVSLMEQEGLRVFMSGGNDMALFAEDAGDVPLIVHRDDFEKAKTFLDEIEAENADFDWSDVDVGEPED
jgi:hypothetical protein